MLSKCQVEALGNKEEVKVEVSEGSTAQATFDAISDWLLFLKDLGKEIWETLKKGVLEKILENLWFYSDDNQKTVVLFLKT